MEPAFNQMQVQPGIQLDFAAGMRALLRQDPDIIMVGEIRDGHTAQMAVQAALTGHSVFSSLHTQDAPSAVIRMLELGIPPYLLKATLTGVMAQRLVRTLCHQCKVAVTVQPADWAPLATTMARPAQIYRPQGCSLCRHTGYRGRTGIHEIMAMTPALGDLLAGPLDSQQLRQQALESGMISLRQAGASLVAQGLTTIEEVLRVTPDSPKKTPRTQPQGH